MAKKRLGSILLAALGCPRDIGEAVVDERLACAELMATLRKQSRNNLFRSALTIAEGEIRARGAK